MIGHKSISQSNHLQEPTLGDIVLVQVLLLVVGAMLRLLVEEVVQLRLLVPFFVAFGTKAGNAKEPHQELSKCPGAVLNMKCESSALSACLVCKIHYKSL